MPRQAAQAGRVMRHAIDVPAPTASRAISLVLLVLAALVAGCASLPPLEGRTPSTAMLDTVGTTVGHAVADAAAAHPGTSGVHAIPNPLDAFAARMLLARAAERSIDAQYYIWRGDQVGNLLLEALWQAADRGVRVRLLLDDVGTLDLDSTVAMLGAHPNIEVRIYNPFAQRTGRALGFLTDFERLNRRMHNKSFTVDNQATVVGGRNIGNEYFAADSGVVFADLDVIAVGPVVREVSSQFDLYWNSGSAYPATALLGSPPPQSREGLGAKFAATREDPACAPYLEAVRSTPIVRELIDRTLALEWTTVRLLYDDPQKTLDTTGRSDVLMLPQLLQSMGPARAELDLVSPYLVPGEQGTAALVATAARGVKVRVLSNSLSSNDASVVHAGYAKRRVDLLRAGIDIYELKATRPRKLHEDEHEGMGSTGAAALHAKTLAVDGQRVFVGSMNMDPRSARLNTELGMVIDSPALARRLAGAFDSLVPQVAYRVRLMPDGRSLEWIERTASGEIRYDSEPNTRWLTRVGVGFMSILPIDSLL